MPATAANSNQQRVLTFLSLLDDDVIEHTLRRMDPDVAERVRGLLTEVSAHRPSISSQKAVVAEFQRFFKFAVKYAKPTIRMHQEEAAAPPPAFEPSDEPLNDLNHLAAAQVTAALEEETPRTAAILLNEMSHERTAEILTIMRDDVRRDVVSELSLNPTAPPVLLNQIARALVERASTLPTEREQQSTPVERMAEVLRATEKKLQMEMLRTLQAQNEEMADDITKLLFRFQDLPQLDDNQVRSVLSKVETSVLATALFQADEEIAERIFSNMSKRARESLQEELSFLSSVPETQVVAARDTVGAAIAEIAMEGQ